ncbi:hypothetical protein [Streptomyces sp. NBC_00306]|nr:hypothetical protein [Streptomyces sp. NBC_00306]
MPTVDRALRLNRDVSTRIARIIVTVFGPAKSDMFAVAVFRP